MRGQPFSARLALPLLGAAAFACSPAPSPHVQDPPAEALAAMDSVYARFARAYALGEPDSVVALYTDTPMYLPAGAQAVLVGRASLREQFGFLTDLRSRGATARITFESVDRGSSGDLGYDVGYYHLQVAEGERPPGPAARGKFVTVWRRGADGRWRIHVDGFSPAGPPSP